MYQINLSKENFSGEKHSWVVASIGPKSITAVYDYDTGETMFHIRTLTGLEFESKKFHTALEYFNDN
jgi:hypothetical protein